MKLYDISAQSSERHPGPNLLLLTLIYLAFLVLGPSQVSASFHIPLDSASKAVAFVAASGGSIKWGSFFELASAMPLCVFIATTTSRLRFLGVRAAGESIAFLGGIIATTMLMLSALSTWSLTRPGVPRTPPAQCTRCRRSVSSAGALDSSSLSVCFWLAYFLPPAYQDSCPDGSCGWELSLPLLPGELASFTLVNFTAGYFIPVGRFISILWMIALSLTLPVGKPILFPIQS